jgi:transposase
MRYGIDLRKKVILFLDKGGTYREAARVFGITMYTISKWKNLLKETGSLEHKKRQTTFKKIDPAKLSAYVESHPDAYLKEIASEFNCSAPAVFLALRKLKITLKKRSKLIEKEMNKNGKNLSRNYVRLIPKE